MSKSEEWQESSFLGCATLGLLPNRGIFQPFFERGLLPRKVVTRELLDHVTCGLHKANEKDLFLYR